MNKILYAVIPIVVSVIVLGAYIYDVSEKNSSFVKSYHGEWSLKHCTFGMKSVNGYNSCIEEDEWYEGTIGTEYAGFDHSNMIGYGLFMGETNTKNLTWNDYDYFFKFQKQSDCEERETWIPLANQTEFNPDNGHCSYNAIVNIVVGEDKDTKHESYTKSKVIQLNWNGKNEITLQSGEKYSFGTITDIQLDDEITILKTDYGVTCIPVSFDIINFGSVNNTSIDYRNLLDRGNLTVSIETWESWKSYENQIKKCELENKLTEIEIFEVNGIKLN